MRDQLALIEDLQRENAALRESETRYRELIEQAAEGVFLADGQGNFVAVNRAGCELLGYTREEILHLNMRDLAPPEDRAAGPLRFDELRAGQPAYSERQIIRKDGRRLTIEISGKLLSDGQLLGFVRDISERRRAEQNLELLARASHELSTTLDLRYIYTTLHRIIQRAMPCEFIFVSSFDADDQLIRCVYGSSPQGELDVLAFPLIPLEAEGRGTQSLVIRSGEPLLLNDYAAYLQTASTTYYVTEDGNLQSDIDKEPEAEQPHSALIVPLKLEGRVIGVIQAMSMHLEAYTPHDLQFLESLALHVSTALANAHLFAQVQNELAERQRAEEALRLQSAALEAAANSIIITNRAGVIEWANAAFTLLTGYTLAEVIGRNPRDLIRSGKQSREFYRELWNTVSAGEVWRGEIINRRKDGTLYVEEMTITPVCPAGSETVAHFIAIKQDVTARQQVDLALRQYAERLRTLHEIDRGVAVAQSPRETALTALQHLRQLVPSDQVSVMLFDHAAQQMVVLAAYTDQPDERLNEVRFPVPESALESLHNNETVLINDTTVDTNPGTGPVSQRLLAGGIRSYIAAPLLVEGELIGLLNVWAAQPQAYDRDHLDIIRELSLQLSYRHSSGAAARADSTACRPIGATRSRAHPRIGGCE